ncbi:uncharacterized protein Dvir_GJ15845 [Drosophila virilis]|uniref:Uncharacterized protein n=1 Tax=Drosophila virilis TaxID=7244 RepID=B4MA51_DROVI|nr:uncharacterized protein Dvir_GJ15845 [Drosophila virilis]
MTAAETEENGPSNSSRNCADAPRSGLPPAQDQVRDQRLELKQSPNARTDLAQGFPCAGGQPKVYPTLRLRLRETIQSVPEAAETDNVPVLVQGPRQAGGRSSSSTSRLVRQAVTQPRRVSTPPASTRPVEMMPMPSPSPSPSASAKQELLRRRQSRREAHRLHSLKQMRKQMSEKCYEDWLHAKRRVQCSARLPNASAEAQRKRREESQLCLAQWQQRKRQELEQRREEELRAEQEQRVHEQLRRQLSQLAWERWLAQLAVKTQSNSGLQTEFRQRIRLRAQPSSARQQQQLEQSKLQEQVTSLYLHVPLSAAQRALRRRLDAIDAVHLQRRRR